MRAVSWRHLVEHLQYRLLYDLETSAVPAPESVHQLAAESQRVLASILRAGDLRGWNEADDAWRAWLDLYSYRQDSTGTWIATLSAAHDSLTLALVAWYLHVATRSSRDDQTRLAAAKAAMQRASFLPQRDELLPAIDQAMASADAAAEWSRWTHQEMPEGEVVMLEDLRTGLLRLSVFLGLLQRLPQGAAPNRFFSTAQQEEVRRLALSVRSAIATAHTDVQVSSEDEVVGKIAELRRVARQLEASEIEARPLSEMRLRALEEGVRNAFTSARQAPGYVNQAGAEFELARAGREGELRVRLPRVFLVDEPSAVGQDFTAEAMGRQLAELELQPLLQHWRSVAGDPVPTPRSALDAALLSFFQRRGVGLVLVPLDWRLQQALGPLGERFASDGIAMTSERLIARSEILAVQHATGTWALCDPAALAFSYEREPLDSGNADDDPDAYVIIVVTYILPSMAHEEITALRLQLGE